MNEMAANRMDAMDRQSAAPASFPQSINWPLTGYSFLLIALGVGWYLRSTELVNPSEGLGYWLGIVGGSFMLLLLFYPASKKSQIMRRLGLVPHWFRIHMILGLVGPLLVLYHCNFSVDAFNSKIALYSMLAVAGSGIVGRYFYARIHRGLYGKRTTIEELRSEISTAVENRSGIAVILPKFISELHTISAELLGDQYTNRIGIRSSLAWTVKHLYVRAKLSLKIKQELRALATASATIRNNTDELRRAANQYAKTQVNLMRQVAQLTFYERLFSLWHVFHMPLFIVLVISALAHVLAVHMY